MTTGNTQGAFVAPGPGTWEQDSTHCPRPLTAAMFDFFKDGFERGFKEGTARFGLLFSHLEAALVNNFLYHKKVGVDPTNKEEFGRRLESARKALETKLWFTELDRWDREIKPDSIRRNRALEDVALDRLDTEGLIKHLTAARENAGEMVYRHHIFTIPSVVGIGRYLANTAQWTGLPAGVVLAPLKGHSPVSLGAHQELLEVGAALAATSVGPNDYSGQSADETLRALQERKDRLGAAVRAYLEAIGLRLAGGYDITDPCAIELSDMLLGAIWAAKEATSRDGADPSTVARVRDAVPTQYREQFDELLDSARRMSRLRDERGIYNDMWGTGIMRYAVLESGRRLSAAGAIANIENAFDLTVEEQAALLRGQQAPSSKEASERTATRRGASLQQAPHVLGDPPSAPPPLDGLPPHAAEMMRAMGAAMSELFMPAPETPGAIVGKPVSPGVYTGTARIIRNMQEFNRLRKGDILVTASTSPAFNVVLPLLGAIVTDRGGQLSHAAIVAREYGIPAVVGTLKATSVIKDGARVRVDGSSGRVEVM